MSDKSAVHPGSYKRSKFFWCLHCERVHYGNEWKENGWQCPYKGCDGWAWDAHAWDINDWPRSEHSNYPNNPVIGTVYPLYSFVPENFQD